MNREGTDWWEQSNVCTVNVLEADEIWIYAGDPASWCDVTGNTIYVLKGTKYTFKALPNPSADWPSYAPVWSGAGSGIGKYIDVTFGSEGTETLTAKCKDCDVGKTVNIEVIVPEPDEVSFVGDEHDIYGVVDPVWKRVGNPDNPASYTKYRRVEVEAKFWASDNLTYPTEVQVDVFGAGWGTFTQDNSVTFGSWPSETTEHVSNAFLPNSIGSTAPSFTWQYKVPWPSGTNQWITMTNTSGPHKIYQVYGAPTCGYSNYTKDNLDGAVGKALGEGTESGIASKANDSVADDVFLDPGYNCICGSGFQVNFDAAMGTYPPPPRGMCCCRAEGLDCVLNVLGIGPYTHDYVNERSEPNPNALRVPDQYCSICNKWCARCYWDGFWNNWEGVVKCGGVGSTCYAPANGSITIDEGTYSEIDNRIAIDCGYYWTYGDTFAETCSHLPPP